MINVSSEKQDQNAIASFVSIAGQPMDLNFVISLFLIKIIIIRLQDMFASLTPPMVRFVIQISFYMNDS